MADASVTKAALPPQTVRFVHDMRNAVASVRAGASVLRNSSNKPQVVAQVADALQDQVKEMLALLDGFVGHAATEQVSAPAAPASTPGGALNVLVADDNVDAANTLATFLRMEGHRAVVAFDGEQALTLAADEHPDVMLLDLTMPTRDGYELAREIRSQPWGGSVRLIAVSGWFSPEDRARASAAGFDAQLSKPIDMDRLQQLLSPAS